MPAFPVFRVLVPVEPGTMLLVPALAACAAVGWWAGGRLTLALLWVAVAAAVVVAALPGASPFREAALGWSVLVAALFGVLTLVGGTESFLPRGLATVGLASGAGFMLLLVGGTPPGRAVSLVAGEYRARVDDWARSTDALLASPELQEYLAANPATEQLLAGVEQQLRALVDASATVFPALLALETLAALALAWAIYHRLGRARLGPPLAPLREFRFSDQLVWGLITGITLAVLGSMAEFRGAGLNLLLFFGALYLLRGLGVLLWFLNPGRLTLVLLTVIAVLLWPFVATMALAVGVVDTWTDWRRRARTTTP